MSKEKTRPPKEKFNARKLTGMEAQAARKAAIANQQQYPNRDMSMKSSQPGD